MKSRTIEMIGRRIRRYGAVAAVGVLLAMGGTLWAGEVAGSTSAVAQERFVPGTNRFGRGATLEMRGEATVIGRDVQLRQVCRWSDADAAAFAPVADLVLTRLDAKTPFRSISLSDVKQILQEAGANLAVIRFAGPMSCTVSRSDVQLDERTALDQWLSAREAEQAEVAANRAVEVSAAAMPIAGSGAERTSQGVAIAGTAPRATTEASSRLSAAEEPPKAFHSLRDMLSSDLCTRLGLTPDVVQMQFRAQDERMLNLAEPLFHFEIEARRVRSLGEVAWDVTIVTGDGRKKASIAATARAWQNQLVVTRVVGPRQIIQDGDVAERRTLVDRLADDMLLTRTQVVGEQAATELKPGTVMTARLVEAVPMVKNGQLVDITAGGNGVQVRTVARAMETGSFGQTIRVRNEVTRDTFDVVVTGPQAARVSGGGAARG